MAYTVHYLLYRQNHQYCPIQIHCRTVKYMQCYSDRSAVVVLSLDLSSDCTFQTSNAVKVTATIQNFSHMIYLYTSTQTGYLTV